MLITSNGLNQSPRTWFGMFSTIIQEFDITRSETDHFVSCRDSYPNLNIYSVFYVDDIVITNNG